MIRSARRLLLATSLLLPLTLGGVADGQVEMVRSFTVGAGPAGGPGGGVQRADFERYADLLALDESQLEAAMILHEMYQDERRAASGAMIEQMRAFQGDGDDHQDMMAQLEEITRVTTAHAEAGEALDQALFADLKSLLTDGQADGWPRFERARRRDTTLPGGAVPGGGVDLMKILSRLGLIDAVGEQVDLYEQDLDRVLVERARLNEEEAEVGMSNIIAFDPDSMAEMHERMETFRKNAIRVRDVNRRHARTIGAVLAEADRARFSEAVKRATHPRIFRSSHTDRVIGTALGLDDLTDAQRAELTRISEGYTTRRTEADDRWAIEVDQSDDVGPGGFSTGGGGMAMVRVFGGDAQDEPATPLEKARAARKTLDSETVDQVKAALDDSQASRLPTKRPFMIEGLPDGFDVEFEEFGIDGGEDGTVTTNVETIIIGG